MVALLVLACTEKTCPGSHTLPLATNPIHLADPLGTVDTALSPTPAPCPPAPSTARPRAIPIQTGEDFDFDASGALCTALQGSLVCYLDPYSATPAVVAPGVVWSAAGTRVLPSGDWVIADYNRSALVRVNPATGASTIVVGDLLYPNGLEVASDGAVYVTEHDAGRVRRVDVDTGESTVVAEGLRTPNGLVLSPDEATLYVGSFGAGLIYEVDLETGDASTLYEVDRPDGGLDGIEVGSCGNIYVTEYITGHVYTISPNGMETTLVADLPSPWIPNLRWGRGAWGDGLYVGAFDHLYVIDVGTEGP